MVAKTPSKRKMAVAIAKDVLKRLKLEKLRVMRGNYLSENSRFPETGSLQEQIDKAEANCQVCALGGLFLSHVRLYNNVKCEEVDFERSLIVDSLSPVFTSTELALVEGVFEGIVYQPHLIDCNRYSVWIFYSACENYQKMILSRKKSEQNHHKFILAAICRNIIRNKGKFIIPEACFK